MAFLALRRGEGPVLLREIAESERISEKYLSQIVIPLRSVGLLRSVRGAHGGYELGKEPSEVSVREIVEVLEGGLHLTDGGREASRSRTITGEVVEQLWVEVSSNIARTLDKLSLEEVAKRVGDRRQNPVMYNI